MRRLASSPESVKRRSPELFRSSRPTAIHRPGGSEANTVRRPWGSLRVTSSPAGLWYSRTRGFSAVAAFTGFPSTAISSPGPARAPRLATAPLTLTRPAAIQVSISRRDPRPAAARIFWMRSPGSAACGLAVGAGSLARLVVLDRTGLGFADLLDGRGLKLKGRGDLLERRQLLERAQPEVVEEARRRGVERRPAGGLAVADDVDPAAVL